MDKDDIYLRIMGIVMEREPQRVDGRCQRISSIRAAGALVNRAQAVITGGGERDSSRVMRARRSDRKQLLCWFRACPSARVIRTLNFILDQGVRV